ncbi:MAG: hypothetical protein NZ920_02495 [Aigarchaeota archaeon]|nr:hypothetical protein [Aigarchaeota archaeon]MDW8092506.1 hypothetical protein [Nitrososphaerota archaeon]
MSWLLTLIRVDVLFELACFAISLLVSIGFIRAHLKIGSETFLLLGTGFSIMAGAMLVRSIYILAALASVREPLRFGHMLVQLPSIETIYSVIRLTAYVLFIIAYLLPQLRRPSSFAMMLPTLTLYNPTFELTAAVLLVYIVVMTTVNWSYTRSMGSGEIALGFWALMISHITTFMTIVNFVFYFIGHVTQLIGLILIVIGTWEASRG